MDDHPYYGDRANYFPTIKQQTSYNVNSVVVDPARKEGNILCDEVHFGKNKIIIYESNWHTLKRQMDYLNVVKTREFEGPRNEFHFVGNINREDVI